MQREKSVRGVGVMGAELGGTRGPGGVQRGQERHTEIMS